MIEAATDSAQSVEDLLREAGLGKLASRLSGLNVARDQLRQRASIAAIFNKDIFERLIATKGGTQWTFEDFVSSEDVAAVPLLDGFYKVPQPEQNLDDELRQPTSATIGYCHALLTEWRGRVAAGADAVWLLPHIWVDGEDMMLKHLNQLVTEALDGAALDLDRADFVWRIFYEHSWWISTASPGFEARANAIKRRIDARRFFATDHYKSARYHRRAAVHDALDAFLNASTGSPWILPIFAAGGIGKTIFLRHVLTHEWLRDEALVARIDFDLVGYRHLAAAPWLLLLPIAQHWAMQKVDGTFDAMLKMAKKWGRFLAPLGSDDAASPSEIPPDAQLDPALRLKQIEKQVEKLVGASDDDSDRVVPAQQRCMIVLDTTEELYLHPTSPDEEPFAAILQLLRYLHKSCPGLRVIMAGRYDLFGVRQHDGTERVANLKRDFGMHCAPALEIAGFQLDETKQLLRHCYRANLDDKLAEAVFEKASDPITKRALPFDLDLWARWLRDVPSLTAEDIRKKHDIGLHYLVERVLERIKEDDVRWLVRYSVIPRRLTFAFAREVLWDEIRRQRAKKPQAKDRQDYPNAILVQRRIKPAYSEGIKLAGKLQKLWDKMLRYASGPEEGWLNPDPATGQLRLHERVLKPMRLDLEAQPVWEVLHKNAQAWFEQQAKELPGKPGSESWCSYMSEALYHACQRSAAHGEELWDTLVKQLRPRDWESLAQLAEMVLGEAGFESDDGNATHLFDIKGQPRVSEALEQKAACASMIAALWRWALETDAGERRKLAGSFPRIASRWIETLGESTHPLRELIRQLADANGAMLLNATAGADSLQTVLSACMRAVSSAESLLLLLVQARLIEHTEDPKAALALFAKAERSPVLRNARLTPVPRGRVRQLHTMARVTHSRRVDEAAIALEELIADKSLSPELKPNLRQQVAQLWLQCGQPKRSLRVLSTGLTRASLDSAAFVRAQLLRAQTFAVLGQWQAMAREMDVADKQLPKSDDHARRVLRLELSALRTQQMEAIGAYASAASMELSAIEGFESMGGDYAVVAQRLWVGRAYSLCFHQGNRKEASTIMLKLRDQLGASIVQQPVGFSEIKKKMRNQLASQEGSTFDLRDVTANAQLRALDLHLFALGNEDTNALSTWAARLRESISDCPGDEQLVRHAQLVAAGQESMALLITALAKAQPPSARLLPLVWLEHAPTGKRRALKPAVAALFAKASPDASLASQGIGLAHLHLAEFYRAYGALDQATKLITQAANAAVRRGDAWLWWQASEAAERLGKSLSSSAPTASKNSPLAFILILRQLEHALVSTKRPPVAALKKWLKNIALLIDHSAQSELAHTQYAARDFMVRAKLARFGLLAKPNPKEFLPAAAILSDVRFIEPDRQLERAYGIWEELGQTERANACKPLSKSKGTIARHAGPASGIARIGLRFRHEDRICISSYTFSEDGQTWQTTAKALSLISPPRRMIALDFGLALDLWTKTPSKLNDVLNAMIDPGLDVATKEHVRAIALTAKRFEALPWELRNKRSQPLLYRAQDGAGEMETKTVRWLQDELCKRRPMLRLLVDGVWGSQSVNAFADVVGSPPASLELGSLIEHTRRKLADKPIKAAKNSAVCILDLAAAVTRSMSLQAGRNLRGRADMHYIRNYVRTILHPTKESISGGLTPIVVSNSIRLWHVFCQLDDDDFGNVRLRWHEPLSASVLRNVIKRANPTPSEMPVMLLDIILPPSSKREQLGAIMNRNVFADELWQSGLFNGIIATCWDGARPLTDDGPRLDAIANCAGKRLSLGKTTQMLRDPKWGNLANTTALWTHHPELPFFW